MRKTLIAIAALAGVAANVTVSTKAEARCYGCWAGAAIAAGVIGSAIVANRAYGYGYRDTEDTDTEDTEDITAAITHPPITRRRTATRPPIATPLTIMRRIITIRAAITVIGPTFAEHITVIGPTFAEHITVIGPTFAGHMSAPGGDVIAWG